MKEHLQILFSCAILLFLYCDLKNPNCSDLNQKGYNLYVGNWTFNEIFVVDTECNVIVDTLTFSHTVGSLAITKSAAKIYVASGIISAVDLKTKQTTIIYEQFQSASVHVAPDGQVFVISRTHYQAPWALGLIDTLSDFVSIIDTLDFHDETGDQRVAFAPKSPLIYAFNKENRLFVYNYETKEVVRTYQNLYVIPPVHMIISHDGKRMYTTVGVFDLEDDSIVCDIGAKIFAHLTLSPDGEYLYITDPQHISIGLPVSGKVCIFNTGTNSYVGDIDVNNAVPSGHRTATDHIVIMPDGKTAYVSNWISLVFVLDLQDREAIKAIQFRPTQIHVSPMVIGRKQ